MMQNNYRGGRALLDWTQSSLNQATGLSAVTIRAFERGGEMPDSNRALLRLIMEWQASSSSNRVAVVRTSD